MDCNQQFMDNLQLSIINNRFKIIDYINSIQYLIFLAVLNGLVRGGLKVIDPKQIL